MPEVTSVQPLPTKVATAVSGQLAQTSSVLYEFIGQLCVAGRDASGCVDLSPRAPGGAGHGGPSRDLDLELCSQQNNAP